MRLLFLTLSIQLTAAYWVEPRKKALSPLISFFLSKEVAPCLQRCTQNLTGDFLDFFNGNLSADTYENFCTDYASATECMTTTESCAKFKRSYEALTSGLKWACETEKTMFSTVLPCVAHFKKNESEEENCAKSCGLVLPSESKESGESIVEYLKDTCIPFSCYLNCTKSQFNSKCPTAGTKAVQVALAPFDLLYEEFKLLPIPHKELFNKKVPEECQRFYNYKQLEKMKFDENFMAELRFVIEMMKRQEMGNATAEVLLRRLLKVDEAQPKLFLAKSWNVSSILTCVFMVLLVAFNIIALIFVLFVCCRENEPELGPNLPEIGKSNFIEPNITMKIKKSKVEDSNKELRLYVPRNGNQLIEGDERRCVIVPRNKRQRTVSLPLEPRVRTLSSNSSSGPQVFFYSENDDPYRTIG